MAIQDAAASANSRDRIRYRPSLVQQAPFIMIVATTIFMGVVAGAYGHWQFLFVPVVLAAEWGYLAFGVGITLTPELAIVNNLRRRKIKWADVQGIQIEDYLGSRTIVIYPTNGNRVRLRAPISGFLSWDRRFEEKFHVIGQWWLAHRGADWLPGVQATWSPWVRPADRPRLRPATSQAVPLALLFALFSSEAGLLGIAAGKGVGAPPTAVGRIVAAVFLLPLLTGLWQFGRHGGITLTPDHADVHNLRHRRLPWSQVEDVAVKRTWSGSRIVIREHSGRQTRLSSPRVGLVLWDRDFADKAWAIHRCWQTGSRAAGAQDQTPGHVSSASFLQLGGGGEPRMWKRVLVVVACVALTYELCVSLLVSLLFAVFGS